MTKYWASAYTFGRLLQYAARISKEQGIPLEEFDVIENGRVLYLVSRVVVDA